MILVYSVRVEQQQVAWQALAGVAVGLGAAGGAGLATPGVGAFAATTGFGGGAGATYFSPT